MRILQVIPSLGRGGAERLVLDLTHQLISLGHEVKILILHNQNEYGVLSKDIPVEWKPARVSYSLLGQDTSDTSDFDMAVREFAPDIVHSHLIEAELISRHNVFEKAVYVSHWHGCPEILRKVPLSAFLKKDTWWNWNLKRNLILRYRQCGNHYLCISEFMKDWVIEHMEADPKSCSIVNNAVDTNVFRPMELERDRSAFHLITVGKLNYNKNQQFLIRVVAELIKLGVESDLTLLGSGSQESNLKQLATDLGVIDRIHFLGTVEDPEFHLNKADILVHASHYEAFGLVLLEAMACGKPVVCFNDGGPAEVAENGHNGFAVKRDDLIGFSQAVAKLANDKALYAELSKNALEFSAKYGLTQYANKVVSLYEKLLLARKPS